MMPELFSTPWPCSWWAQKTWKMTEEKLLGEKRRILRSEDLPHWPWQALAEKRTWDVMLTVLWSFDCYLDVVFKFWKILSLQKWWNSNLINTSYLLPGNNVRYEYRLYIRYTFLASGMGMNHLKMTLYS